MSKVLKTILIISIAICGAGLLLVNSVQAQPPLEVDFEKEPLFDEANFLPGQGVNRWVKVINNSGATQRIATEAINVNDPDRLGDVLNLEIKEGGVTHYNDAFSKFFTGGEVYLSDLSSNTQYDFIVTFYSGAQNPFQGKTLSFDILVGFQGEEGGLLPGAGGGAGGFLPPGLTIRDESVRVTTTTETSVTIIWTTSYLSTSQVIYGAEGENHTLDLNDNTGTPPTYGYERTTPKYDTSPKVTSHSVTITGLTSETTYYYRCVSHASLAVSTEHSFTTLSGEGEGKGIEEVIEGKPPEEEGEGVVKGEIEEGIAEEGITEEGIPVEGEEGIEEVGEEGEEEVVVEAEETKIGLDKFLAAIGTFFGSANFCWLFFLLIVILTALSLLAITKKERKKKHWILPIVTLALIILYCIFCCANCWLLILVVAILILLLLFLLKKKPERKE